MTSRQRILAAWSGKPADRVPLTFWCFGNSVPPTLRWQRHGREVAHWYSLRLEHIHTLPQRWDLEDEANRVRGWQSLEVDDLLEVSIPWSTHPEVSWEDTELAPGGGESYPVLVREYSTPAGPLRHAVRRTGEQQGEGWVVQPDHVPLFEDFTIPRAVEHAVSSAEDVQRVPYLYAAPDEEARQWFARRMAAVGPLAGELAVPVQAWSAFGMDAVVWLAGTQSAILMAMDQPQAFGRLAEAVAATDVARTELAASHPGVDMIVMRGWYSSTDFWSPELFDRFVAPHLRAVAETAHRGGKKFAYAMTTGVELLGERLAEAGVDVLYFVDPLLDEVSLEHLRDLLSERMTLVGGTNAITLGSGDSSRIEAEARHALQVLGPTGRFILHPVDAIFPDTPWEGVEALIAAWKRWR